jgi:hypothetical protein
MEEWLLPRQMNCPSCSPSRIMQCMFDVFRFQVGVVGDDFVNGHAISDQIDDERRCDTRTPSICLAPHNIWGESNTIQL